MSINKVILIGRLGQDPELKYTPAGQAVTTFSLATSEMWNDKNGQRQERTEWHRIVVWGKTAENCSKYLGKGRQIFVEGRLQTRSWEKEGQKHYTTEIIANTVQFLGSKGDNAPAGADVRPPAISDDNVSGAFASSPMADNAESKGDMQFTSDDIPF